jgi:hypothetical protein
MSDFDDLSLEEQFESKGFTQSQYRQLFTICIKSKIFKNVTKLSNALNTYNKGLAEWIFIDINIVQLSKIELPHNLIVTYVLSQLISFDTMNSPFKNRYSEGICRLIDVLMHHNTTICQTGIIQGLVDLFASLDLNADQIRYLQKSGNMK